MTKHAALGLLAAATMAAAISAPALATSEPETDEPIAVDIIEGLDWSLTRQEIDGALATLPDGVVITLLMEDGSAGGSGGCNDYFASYQRDGGALTFSDIGSTEMYCDDTSDLEAAYFANLANVTTGFSTGGTLVMANADGDPILELEPTDMGPLATDSIEGQVWQLDTLAQPGTSELTPVPEELVATLSLESGMVFGNGGCNGFSATYELDDTALAFSEVLSTRMACPEPVMTVENALFTQLGSVASWSSDGGSVTLYDEDGSALAAFVPLTES